MIQGFIFIYYRGLLLGDNPTKGMLRNGIEKSVDTIIEDLSEEDVYRKVYVKEGETVILSTTPYPGQDESDCAGVAVMVASETKRWFGTLNLLTRIYSGGVLIDLINELEQKYKTTTWSELETNNVHKKK